MISAGLGGHAQQRLAQSGGYYCIDSSRSTPMTCAPAPPSSQSVTYCISDPEGLWVYTFDRYGNLVKLPCPDNPSTVLSIANTH